MRKIVEVGETLRLYLAYNDIDTGVPIDPAFITATVKNPDATEALIEYPSANFIREGTGAFFVRIPTTMRGTHRYEIRAEFAAGDIDIRGGKFDAELVM